MPTVAYRYRFQLSEEKHPGGAALDKVGRTGHIALEVHSNGSTDKLGQAVGGVDHVSYKTGKKGPA